MPKTLSSRFDTQTPAETSSLVGLSFFVPGSWAFCRTALFGTKTMNIFLSLKLLLSSVASCRLGWRLEFRVQRNFKVKEYEWQMKREQHKNAWRGQTPLRSENPNNQRRQVADYSKLFTDHFPVLILIIQSAKEHSMTIFYWELFDDIFQKKKKVNLC